MIFDTTNELRAVQRMTLHMKQRARQGLEMALDSYLIWHVEGGAMVLTEGDLRNLIEQSIDAIDAVVHAYPPFNQKDQRTLATD
jgi:hypothetical protein